jgi:hypothetical protein
VRLPPDRTDIDVGDYGKEDVVRAAAIVKRIAGLAISAIQSEDSRGLRPQVARRALAAPAAARRPKKVKARTRFTCPSDA